MNGIYLDWFQNSKNIQENVFDKICSSLVSEKKVLKHVYSIRRNQASVEVENKWIDYLDVVDEVEWNYIHNANFKCTIETQMRSFYFKLFHKAICTNQFLHRIGRSDSPNCYFCYNLPETILHLFCECEKVSLLWDELCFLINNISGNPLLSQILKKCLVSQTSQNMTIVLISSFYAWNFIFIDANFSKPTANLLHFNI